MCIPAAAAIAIAVVGTVKAVSQGNDAKRQAASMRQQADREDQDVQAALGVQSEQVDRASVENMSQRARVAMLERGRLSAIAADSGSYGVSQDRVFGESVYNEDHDIALIDANRVLEQTQIDRQRNASTRQLQRAQIAYKQPSGLGTTLSIAGNWIGPISGMMGGGSPGLVQEQVPGQFSTSNPQYG